MREWERISWESGKSEAAVIGQVGEVIAGRFERAANCRGRARQKVAIWALAGKGHNGDDVRLAARVLAARGWNVQLIEVVSSKIASDVAEVLREGDAPDWILDGLFGIGLSRPLEGAWADLVEALNAVESRKLAIDVPSGFSAIEGKALGVAVEADWTLTLGAPKLGLISSEAPEFVGRLEVAGEIGLASMPDFDSELEWIEPESWRNFPPRRKPDTHKGSYGRLLILAGSLGYHGAAVLTARAAQQAQPGWIQLLTDPECYLPVASQLTGPMVAPWEGGEHPWLDNSKPTAIVAGPGLASHRLPECWMEKVRKLWKTFPGPMIVDASGLSALAEMSDPTSPTPGPRILTPHPGEAASLLQTSSKVIQNDRISALRKLSARFGNAWVVLKGHQTLIGNKEGKIAVNSSGNPGMAQGGSGDILTGFIGGLLAQPQLHHPGIIETTIRYAVWAHGNAADRLHRRTSVWPVERLIDKLG